MLPGTIQSIDDLVATYCFRYICQGLPTKAGLMKDPPAVRSEALEPRVDRSFSYDPAGE